MRSDAERTAKAIVAGTWGCALLVMAGSATNAFLAYGAIGDNRALGLATGLAVDIGLCVALIGDRRLYAHGLSSNWGRGLRLTTAVMSLILNTAIAIRDSHYLMALLHAFLPVLLIVLTEYGQDVLLKYTKLRRDVEAMARDAARAAPQPAAQSFSVPAVAAPPLPQPMTPAVSIPPSQGVIPPRPAPTPAPQPRPTPPVVDKPTTQRPAATRTNQVTAELLRRGRALQTDRAIKGLPKAGRRVLMVELDITDRVARELVSQLATEPNLEAVA